MHEQDSSQMPTPHGPMALVVVCSNGAFSAPERQATKNPVYSVLASITLTKGLAFYAALRMTPLGMEPMDHQQLPARTSDSCRG